MKIDILIPAYREAASLTMMVPDLDSVAAVLRGHGHSVSLMIVDDASPDGQPGPAITQSLEGAGLEKVEVVTLRRNLGHQRAIAVGLCRLHRQQNTELIVVMDADGEDRPTDVSQLLEAIVSDPAVNVVFAERTKRSEGLVFRVGYLCYRVMHRILVGFPIRFGNFSVLRRAALERLVIAPELWNHYAAAVVSSRIPLSTIPTTRATRLAGGSTMNVEALVIHGLSAMSVFGDRIGVRLLGATTVASVVAALGILAAVWIRVFTSAAIPGWATFTSGILLILIGQFVISSFVFVLMVLTSRNSSGVCPMTDHVRFVLQQKTIWRADGS